MPNLTPRRGGLRRHAEPPQVCLADRVVRAATILGPRRPLKGTAFVVPNRNSVVVMDELYLPNATIKLFDSTRTIRLYQATSDALGQSLFKDGNGTAFNDNLTAGADQLLDGPPKQTLRPKDRAPQTLVHRPSTLGNRLTRFGIVIH